jgi:hypothetical protein
VLGSIVGVSPFSTIVLPMMRVSPCRVSFHRIHPCVVRFTAGACVVGGVDAICSTNKNVCGCVSTGVDSEGGAIRAPMRTIPIIRDNNSVPVFFQLFLNSLVTAKSLIN